MAAAAMGRLDFSHAGQARWTGAASWRDGRTPQARRWGGWARHRLRQGQPDGVWAALVDALAVEDVPDATRETVPALSAYVERHRDHRDEAPSQALGVPRGSGRGARACQWLRQQRCKGGGMRWSAAGLTHLFPLRLAWVNGSCAALFQGQLPPSPNT